MRLIVAIPTANRPDVVLPTVRAIAQQTRLPDLVIAVVSNNTDIDPDAVSDLPFPVSIVHSPKGLTIQRNAALAMLHPEDCLLFLDDDFVMAVDYLMMLERLFQDHPNVVMATGTVLADGIHGPGLSHEYALDLVSADAPQEAAMPLSDIYNCYGCNMALRAQVALGNGVRFDPRLRLYGWLEDVDFSRQMAAHGRIVKAASLRGVHLGTRTGRSSGLCLGYIQVSNPLYLYKKGTMTCRRALTIMWRNLASNMVKSLRPEPGIDRAGRLQGNLLALADLVRGQLRPEQVMELE